MKFWTCILSQNARMCERLDIAMLVAMPFGSCTFGIRNFLYRLYNHYLTNKKKRSNHD